ncbi:MAG: 50S ribosomal protein L6 [Anaerolineae bacterium]
MSRVGKKPIEIPANVVVEIEGSKVTVKGPRGELSRVFHPDITISQRDGQLVVERPTDNRSHRSLHGLTRALLANMVKGVAEGFRKRLEIRGVGYRAEMQGDDLVMQLGFSHPVRLPSPPGITITVERGGRNITVEGNDKELVGEIAARIRKKRPPEPYKGKGIRYVGERVRRKAGKAGKIGVM